MLGKHNIFGSFGRNKAELVKRYPVLSPQTGLVHYVSLKIYVVVSGLQMLKRCGPSSKVSGLFALTNIATQTRTWSLAWQVNAIQSLWWAQIWPYLWFAEMLFANTFLMVSQGVQAASHHDSYNNMLCKLNNLTMWTAGFYKERITRQCTELSLGTSEVLLLLENRIVTSVFFSHAGEAVGNLSKPSLPREINT